MASFRLCIKNFEYGFANDFLIPCRAISHDERKFKHPEQLNPDRQLDDQGNLRKDYDTYVFGFGRRCGIKRNSRGVMPSRSLTIDYDRICPGRHLATESVSLFYSYIL